MSAIDDLNAALQAETAAITQLGTLLAGVSQPPDLSGAIAAVNANKATVDGYISQLGGTPGG